MGKIFDFTKYRPWNIKKNIYSQWKNSLYNLTVNKKISYYNCDHIRLYATDTSIQNTYFQILIQYFILI